MSTTTSGVVAPYLEGVELVDQLDVSTLPYGCVRRFHVVLAHGVLDQPIVAPVMVARGRRDGPVFGMSAALHGDELNGIRVIHELFDRVDLSQLRGTLVGIIAANVPGMSRHQRVFHDGTDLNHIMPGREGGTGAQVWAHRLLTRLVSQLDYLVDMHTASAGRINSLYIRADMSHDTCARMTYMQRPQIILHNPANDGTLRGAAMALGIPAVTVEIGNPGRFQTELIRTARVGLRAVLGELGMVPLRKLSAGREPVLCDASSWLYTSGGGLLEVLPAPTDVVAAGEVIALRRDLFGRVLHEYRAPDEGVVIGKSINPTARTGSRILHLGSFADGATGTEFLSRDRLRSLRLPRVQ